LDLRERERLRDFFRFPPPLTDGAGDAVALLCVIAPPTRFEFTPEISPKPPTIKALPSLSNLDDILLIYLTAKK
jgi:hypothetical protein